MGRSLRGVLPALEPLSPAARAGCTSDFAADAQLNSGYCQRFNRRHDCVGPVLQGRFGCRIVEDGAYYLTATITKSVGLPPAFFDA